MRERVQSARATMQLEQTASSLSFVRKFVGKNAKNWAEEQRRVARAASCKQRGRRKTSEKFLPTPAILAARSFAARRCSFAQFFVFFTADFPTSTTGENYHWINRYPTGSRVGFVKTYSLVCRYWFLWWVTFPFEQPRPGGINETYWTIDLHQDSWQEWSNEGYLWNTLSLYLEEMVHLQVFPEKKEEENAHHCMSFWAERVVILEHSRKSC